MYPIQVKDLMKKGFLLIKTSHTFTEMCALFIQTKFQFLPVVDVDGKVVGVIRSNDALLAYNHFLNHFENREVEALNTSICIEEIMLPIAECLGAEEDIVQAVHCFARQNFQALPVVAAGEVVGIITANDVLRYLALHESILAQFKLPIPC